jgi:hypothetical protein
MKTDAHDAAGAVASAPLGAPSHPILMANNNPLSCVLDISTTFSVKAQPVPTTPLHTPPVAPTTQGLRARRPTQDSGPYLARQP